MLWLWLLVLVSALMDLNAREKARKWWVNRNYQIIRHRPDEVRSKVLIREPIFSP